MAAIIRSRPGRQASGDDRHAPRDQPSASGTSGAFAGLTGAERPAVVTAWLAGVAVAASVCAFNILTHVHDWPEQGMALPAVLEGTSLAMNLLAFSVCAAAAVWLKRHRPAWSLAAAVNLVGLAGYAVLHIGGFMALRALLFPPLVHCAYEPGPLRREIPYELSKDAVTYVVATTGFWLRLGWMPRSAADAGGRPETFDIRDGARLVRAPVSEILAVRSAGNYVEFLLADGRELLMRSPLSAVETALAPAGFLRTHRSWLLNAARVTALRPEGSGDYAVELGTREAPLSRRFPQALAALRG
jgi:DNA-binding LytR/AlgR family response regulator